MTLKYKELMRELEEHTPRLDEIVKKMAINKINYKLQQIVDFFENDGTWDKDEILADMISDIKEIRGRATDEIGLEWDGQHLMVLEDFIEQLYQRLIKGVCNVVTSFKE